MPRPIRRRKPPKPPTPRPSIIVFLTDDMRSEDWAALPKAREAIGGTEYPNFLYPTSKCSPSRASLLTGLYAHNHGVTKNDDADFRDNEEATYATALQRAGYHTAYVGKYFNKYDGTYVPPGWDDWRPIEGHPTYDLDGDYATYALRDRAISAINAAPRNQPLLLVVGFNAPHNPATPPPGTASTSLPADRTAAMGAVDDAIVEIIDALGYRDDATAMLLLSDNGYVIDEAFVGKDQWWDPSSRVPMRARVPGVEPGVDSRLAATIDICPTLCAIGGASAPPADGRSLLDPWDREGVLLEGWSDGGGRTPYQGIKGRYWVYAEPEGEGAHYYPSHQERHNAIATIDAEGYHHWLHRYADCRGEECRDAEYGRP
jgi:arylsulfatase A-like enzyme